MAVTLARRTRTAKKTAAPRGRGRPTPNQTEQITANIVRAALALFLREGYGATSMKRIGEAAGVAPATLYARFPDKESLFAAAVDHQVQAWKMIDDERSPAPASTLKELLEALARDMVAYLRRPEVAAFDRLMVLESTRLPQLAAVYRSHAIEIGHQTAVNRIMATAEGKTLGKKKVNDLATTLREVVIGAWHLGTFSGGQTGGPAERATIRRIVKLLLCGVSAAD